MVQNPINGMDRNAGRKVCIFYLGENIFPFYAAKVADCFFLHKASPLGAWLAGKKSSSLRCGIFSRQTLCRKQPIHYLAFVKSGKHTPMGSFT